MTVETLVQEVGEWLRGSGPESDIVMSTRIRLARNLADFPFIRRCSDIDRANIEVTVRERMCQDSELSKLEYVNVAQLDDLDRQVLVERQLISRELAEAEGARTVAIDSDERHSIMINEEDHLRIQVMQSGLDVEKAWDRINRLDDTIETHVNYAFDETLGYLTACPTNVGTGLRVSVLVHLPALVITQQIDKAFRSLNRINLVVRGLHGEGSEALGDFYQVSNQITLGKTEDDLVRRVAEVVPVLLNYERKARDFLMNENQHSVFDQVSRAYGTLQTAQQISSEEAMHNLSRVRLGINLGLIDDLDIAVVNRLFVQMQPAHLQKLTRKIDSSSQRNIERANYLHAQLKSQTKSSDDN
ncbi:MAG: protein arginine kinase [Pirellulaceae bacterium]